jgi:hypothetical protein
VELVSKEAKRPGAEGRAEEAAPGEFLPARTTLDLQHCLPGLVLAWASFAFPQSPIMLRHFAFFVAYRAMV